MKDKKFAATCKVCNEKFSHWLKKTQICSDKCRREYHANLYRRNVIGDVKVPTGSVGAASELVVSSILLLKDFCVFRSLSPNCFCDLIATKEGKSYFLEVRTGYESKTGNVLYPKRIHKDATHFAVFERNTRKVFFFDKNGKESGDFN